MPGGKGDKRWIATGLAVALSWATSAWAAGPVAPVIPEPLNVAPAAGAPVVIADGARIAAEARDADTARMFAGVVLQTRRLHLAVQKGGRGAAIRLVRRPGLGPEAYRLTVGKGGARIEASDPAGLYYGAVTLWQLITADGGQGRATLAPMTIEDRPRFRWRGLMLDSARHFQTLAEIRRLIDWMALHKLNVLHWHLTDDQGWRLQILKYPRLTEVGAWRTPPAGSPDQGPRPYGGVYTQAEARAVVAYAAARHILVVPEIEMPGHAISALLAYPELGTGAPPRPEEQSHWGGFPYVFNVEDRTFGVLEDVLTEVMAIFPSPYIHVGGDEAEAERWNGDPAVQARMAALGIKDAAGLQAHFTQRIAQFLKAHGRRLVGWDEILNGGGLASEAVVMSWHGVSGAANAAAAGHDAILAPAPILYFDNWQAVGADQPPGRGYLVPLKDVYGFEPLPASFDAASAGHILGLEAALWTEHIRSFDELQAMAFPRAAALAEVGWSDPSRRDWRSFLDRLPAQMKRYAALGLGADPVALSVRIEAEPGSGPGEATVTLSSQADGGEIRYTLDGSAPSTASPLYTAPLAAQAPGQVKATVFVDGAQGPVSGRQLTAGSIRRRQSQELRLCNDKLALNLEGPGQGHPAYLTNPQEGCWIYPAADLDGVKRLEVGFTRLPFVFGLDPAHNTAVVRPPRTPGGELEVRQDGCLSDPIAVAPVPPPGGATSIAVDLPPRTGRHDLCVLFTSSGFDPMLVLDHIQIEPPGAP
jgi:hexosaminidase